MDARKRLTFSREASKAGTEVCVLGFGGPDAHPLVKNASPTAITASTIITKPVESLRATKFTASAVAQEALELASEMETDLAVG